MKRYLKLFSISVLSFVLALSSIVNVSANDKDDFDFKQVYGDLLRKFDGNQSSNDDLAYQANELVDIIVEVEGDPLVDLVSANSDIKTYAASRSGKQKESALLSKQDKVATDIAKAIKDDVSIDNSYTNVMNGFSFKTEFKNLEAIQKTPQVKRAYVAQRYDITLPNMGTSNDIVGTPQVWQDLGFKGEGMVVGILDTGLDLTHPAFQQDLDNVKIDKSDIQAVVDKHKLNSEAKGNTVDNMYYSSKIPFQYDYADKDHSVSPSAPKYAKDVDHGTHVAGTVGGFDDGFSGVAPNAQLMIFKVFSDTSPGASDVDITAALDDAVLLGVDVINMSLGSSSGFSKLAQDSANDVYARVGATGIILDISAGNATSAADRNLTNYDLTTAWAPDHGIVGSPSTYRSALSVASMDNTFMVSSGFKIDGQYYSYSDTTISIRNIVGQELDYVMVPGVGAPADYSGLDVTGKIAVVSRGEIDFEAKVKNAYDAGAVATIVYNNVDDNGLINMVSDNNKIPAIFVTKQTAEVLRSRTPHTLKVEVGEVTVENTQTPNAPSAFSSIGTTNLLEIKPEISAPGGYIYSSVPRDTGSDYASMNGTSMASPHVAGISALVKQYVNSLLPDLSDLEKVELVNAILMSTAVPADLKGVPYAVRKQGAGLINAYHAITTPAYLSNGKGNADGSKRPKLELGDDVAKTGVYNLSFDVVNMSDEPISYKVNTLATADKVLSDDKDLYVADQSRLLEYSTSGDTIVEVAANSKTTVNVSITLSDEEKAYLDAVYENGAFVEGFVTLSNDDNPDLSIPFLGFYGDWEAAPLFDTGSWINGKKSLNFFNQAHDDNAFLGGNHYWDSKVDYNINPNMLTLSPNGDGLFDKANLFNGLIRNAESVITSITNKDTGDIVYQYDLTDVRKTSFNSSANRQVPYSLYVGGSKTWDLTDLNGNKVPDGRYVYKAEASLGYRDGVDDVITYELLVDTQKPNAPQGFYSVEDGRRYLNLRLSDNNYLVESIVVGLDDKGNPTTDDLLGFDLTLNNELSEHIYKIDVTERGGDDIYMEYFDSGLNPAQYVITINEVEMEELTLNIGAEHDVYFDVDTTDADWSSSDDSVVTVDASGHVNAVGYGDALITASRNGKVLGKLNITVVNMEAIQLNKDIDSYEDIADVTVDGEYTSESWNAFLDALAAAKEILDNPDSSQADLAAASASLAKAYESLKFAVKNVDSKVNVKSGSTFVLNPQPAGGTWSYDDTYLRIVEDGDGINAFSNHLEGTRFEALKTGVVTLTYTTPQGVEFDISLTIEAAETPDPDKPETPDVPEETDKPVNPDDKVDPVDPVDPGKPKGEDEVLGSFGISDSMNVLPYVLITVGLSSVVVYFKKKEKEEGFINE